MEIILGWFVVLFVLCIIFGKAELNGMPAAYGIQRIFVFFVLSVVFSLILGFMTIGILYVLGIMW